MIKLVSSWGCKMCVQMKNHNALYQQNKTHMISRMEKVFDKCQHTLMIKSLNKQATEGFYLSNNKKGFSQHQSISY